MSWGAFFLPPLREHEGGLYRARQMAWALVKALVLAAAGVGVLAFGQMHVMAAVYLALAGWLGWRWWSDRQRFGPLGRPLVRIHDGMAIFALPSRWVPRQLEIALRDVKSLTLRGDALQRQLVWERRHGEPLDFTTSYGRHDARVVQFLRQHLPERVKLVVLDAPDIPGDLRGPAR